jgi:hypothetical protein
MAQHRSNARMLPVLLIATWALVLTCNGSGSSFVAKPAQAEVHSPTAQLRSLRAIFTPAGAAVFASGVAPPALAEEPQPDASSIFLAKEFGFFENPSIGFVFLVAMGSMSIALVVWGRNGL